jgi:4-diphosphocytidyl-2-C-methyl-D-erythritol kinase
MKAHLIKLEAPAKLNLFLEVLRKRADGYHEIRSILHAINLCDEVAVRERKRGVQLVCTDASLPRGERNIAWRAAELMRRRARTAAGVVVRLVKRIPVGAGLGGGSSDAAAVLKAVNQLWRLGLSPDELMQLAAQLGSDCPFFIPCGTALCEGRGELVTPLTLRRELHFVLVCPPIGLATTEVYRNLTKNDLTSKRADDRIIQKILETGDVQEIGQELFNRLEGPAFRLLGQLRAVKEQLSVLCRGRALMTGSGSALFGILDNASEVKGVVARLAPLGLGMVVGVESWNPEQAARLKGGGRREDHRGKSPTARDEKRSA